MYKAALENEESVRKDEKNQMTDDKKSPDGYIGKIRPMMIKILLNAGELWKSDEDFYSNQRERTNRTKKECVFMQAWLL